MEDFMIEDDEEERPIASLSWDCDELFQDCFVRLDLSTSSTKELLGTYAQRFTSWWESLGVFAGQHADLDRRLQRQSDVRDIIIRLLLVLRRNLAHLISQKGGKGFLEGESLDQIKPVHGLDGDSDDVVYLRSIFLDAIDGSLAKLNHIGNAIRQSARLPEVVRARNYASQHLHLTSYQALSTVALQTMYPDAPESLISQLTESMVDRYALIFFRKFRKGILSKDNRDVQARGGYASRDGRSQAQKFEASQLVAGTASPHLEDPARTHDHLPSEFAPTSHDTGQLRERLKQDSNARTRRSTTVILSSSNEPPISGTRNEYGDEVPCEWCFEKVGRELVKNNRWTAIGREHYRADLRPFVCIAAHCMEADNAFPSTRAWAQHMNEHHSAWAQHIHQEPVWVCNIPTEEGRSGDHAIFSSVRRLRHHLMMMHPADEDTTAAQALLEAPVTVGRRKASTCLLCGFELELPHIYDETTILQDVVPSIMVSHVAEHLQNIMVLSLRLLGTQEEVDESVNSVVSENDSLVATSTSDSSSSSAGQALSSFASQPEPIHEADEAVNTFQIFFSPEESASDGISSTMPWGKNIDIWMKTVISDKTSDKERVNLENLARSGSGVTVDNGASQSKVTHAQSSESKHSIKSEAFMGLQGSDIGTLIHRLPKQNLDGAGGSKIMHHYTSELGPPTVSWDSRGVTSDNLDVQSTVFDAGHQLQLQHSIGSTVSPGQVHLAGELQELLYDRLQPVDSGNDHIGREFLPLDDLDRLVNETSVRHELRKVLAERYDETTIEHYVTEICRERLVPGAGRTIKSFRKIFALLVILDATASVRMFLDEDVSDIDLPLQWESTAMLGLCRKDSTRTSAPPLRCFARWSRVQLRNFFEYQWKLLAVFFHEDRSQGIKHYILRDQHILPFLKVDKKDLGEEEKTGGFAKVKMVQIHPAHHNFSNPNLYNRGFAVKQQLYESDTATFQTEIDVLKKFSGDRGHHHIVSLLATFEQYKKLHLIFHRAQGDLFGLWSDSPEAPICNYDNIKWLAEQCEGLADGLLRLHRHVTFIEHRTDKADTPYFASTDVLNPQQLPSDNGQNVRSDRLKTINTPQSATSMGAPFNPEVEENRRRDMSNFSDGHHVKQYGRHGDIHPGNILWYDNSDGALTVLRGTLKLADFGQAELNSLKSRSGPRNVAGMGTYRPPESDRGLNRIRPLIQQTYDMWCLGCVYLELLTWFLGGDKCLQHFVKLRLAPDYFEKNMSTDNFFQVTRNYENDTYEVVVKEKVIQFIDGLHKHQFCTDYCHDLLNLIQHDMLVVDSNGRKSCQEVWKTLNKLYRRCCTHEDYATKKTPWRFERSSVSRPVAFRLKEEPTKAALTSSKISRHVQGGSAMREEQAAEREQPEAKAHGPRQNPSSKSRRRGRGKSSATSNIPL